MVEIAFSISDAEPDAYFEIDVFNVSDGTWAYRWDEAEDTSGGPLSVADHPDANLECVWFADTGDDNSTYQDRTTANLPGNEVLRIDFRRVDESSGSWQTVETFSYTYYSCNGGADAFGNVTEPEEQFFCPVTRNVSNGDTHFIYDGGEMHVGVTPGINVDLPENRLNSYFSGDDWIIPYNGDVVCASPDYDCGEYKGGELENRFLNAFKSGGTFAAGTTVFVTPQVLPELTFADEFDTVIPVGVSSEGLTVEWTFGGAFANTELKFPEGRKLRVEGQLIAEDVTLTKTATGDWGGVVVAGGNLTTQSGTVIEEAAIGVEVFSPGTADLDGVTLRDNGAGLDVRSSSGAVITGSTVVNNGIGIRSGPAQPYTGPSACFGPCRSVLTVTDSDVRDNGTGIFAADVTAEITGTVIEDNSGYGLYVSNALVNPFQDNLVRSNGHGTDANGVLVAAGGDFFLSPLEEFGLNRIALSATTELFVASGGYAFAGDDSGESGYNAIFDTNTSDPLIYNISSSEVEANFVYWGTGGAPPAGSIVGNVDDTLPLACDPVIPADPSDPNPCAQGSRAEFMPVALERSGSGEEASRSGLGEEIRAVRAALAADPASDAAAGLVHRLAGLHKRDRSDAQGEHAATFGLLRSLRARLNRPALPAGLRATAEAALQAGVLDALASEQVDDVAQALAVWRPHVESAEVLRVLYLVEAALASRGGDHATASGLVAAVAESEPNEEAERGLLALAAHYGARAEEAGRSEGGALVRVASALARLGGGTRVAEGVGLESGLALWPNPFSGRDEATVALVVAERSDVRVAVYDVLGREVTVLHDGPLRAGEHRLRLDGQALPAGVYVVRAEVGVQRLTERITLVR
jgi:hypothetical protein